MKFRVLIAAACLATVFLPFAQCAEFACCGAPAEGRIVLNADQTVVLIWDPASKIEHFIRKASFKSDSSDFGFLIPSPSQPELEESGNDAFPFLQKLTEPEIITKHAWQFRSMGCGGDDKPAAEPVIAAADYVNVLDEKRVAGFDAVVLEASSAGALTSWLKAKGYAMSPEIEAWAKPYVDLGWKITALKVAQQSFGNNARTIDAAALRLSFKTDRPLFPYREPDYNKSKEKVHAYSRLLRIYYIGEARYAGELTQSSPWTGKAVWSERLKPEDRAKTLDLLKLPPASGPAEFWLTEFEDPWPYAVAPADVYFSRDVNQAVLHRPPIIRHTYSYFPSELTCFALFVTFIAAMIWRYRARKGS